MKRFHTIFIETLLLISLLLWVSTAKAQDDGIKNLRQTSKAFASVARSVSPSVVFIQVEGKTSVTPYFQFPFDNQGLFGNEFFERFFGEHFRDFSKPNNPEYQQKIVGQGSGFVFAIKDILLSDKTYIMTNNHVVQNAEKIKIILQDKREFIAKIVGVDPKSDIALLEINTSKLPALILGDSSALEVGEWVIAIGNPFGLSHTLTVGVVSAKGRTSLGISDYEDFIQTDAAINPGNSGGPLVNLNGEVVGMNTAIFSRSGGYMGIGFAIPINLAKSIGEQLMNNGEVSRGHLGIVVQELSESLANSFKLEQNDGILVSQVIDDSPAANAGLKQGDVIYSFDGKPVDTVGKFRNFVALSTPKSKKNLTILRDGKYLDIVVTIGRQVVDEQALNSFEQQSEELGLTVKTITPNLAQRYDVKPNVGVLVVSVKPSSVAELSGIATGTVILQVDRKPVNNAEEFASAVKKSRQDKTILLLVLKNNVQHYVVLSW